MDFFNYITDIFKEAYNNPNEYLGFMLYLAIIIFIGTFIYYFLYLFARYYKFQKILIEETKNNEDVDSRIHGINKKVSWLSVGGLSKVWKRYFNEYNNGKNETVPDPLFYFNTDELVTKAGRRKLIEIIPASFVSLGLLGTFLGIIVGVSNLSTNAGSEELLIGVDTLLSGMAIAFKSSVLGILLSLGYQFFDRLFFYRALQGGADWLIDRIDKSLPIETESSLLERVATAQEAQMNDLKTFLTDEMLPSLTSGISESISTAIIPQLEQSNVILDKVAQNTLEAQSESLNEMVNHFVKSLNEITGNQIEELGLALQRTVEWQERVYNELNNLVEQLISVSIEQAEMADKTTILSEKMSDYTEKLGSYQDNLSDSTEKLEDVTKENTNLLSQMNETYEMISTRREEEESAIERRLSALNETVDKITNLGSSFADLNSEVNSSLSKVISTTEQLGQNAEETQKLTESLIEQHELSNQWSTKTHEILEDISLNITLAEDIQSTLQELFDSVSKERAAINNIQEQYGNRFVSSVDKLSKTWNENYRSMHASQVQFSELNTLLNNSMESFAEHMQRGIQGTFEQFDAELKKAIEYLATGVTNIGDFVLDLEEAIASVDNQVNKFNESVSNFNSVLEEQVTVNE